MKQTTVRKSALSRLLSICLVLAMLLSLIPLAEPTANAAETKMLYLDASGLSWWEDGGAVTRAWAWKSGGDGAWYDMSLVNDIYQAEIPSDADMVIFFRANPASANYWDSSAIWARSKGDMAISGNCYTVTGTYSESGTNYTNGFWSTYTPPADVYSLAGSMNSWSTTANIMEDVGAGKFSTTFSLIAGNSYQFKVVKNSATWIGYSSMSGGITVPNSASATNDGNDNIVLSNLQVTGNYIFNYDSATNKLEITLSCTHPEHNQDGKCTTCGQSVDHTFVAGTPVAPTCTTEGYTPYTCACGKTENRDTVPVNDHDYVNGECTMCGATLKTIYLVPGVWEKDDPIYQVVAWKNGEASNRYTMTAAVDGKYKVDIPSDCDMIHFYRMSSNGTQQWNDVADQSIDGNCFTITDWGTGTWSDFNPCTHPVHDIDGICTSCGEKVEHNYISSSVVTPPTCTAEGYTTHYCYCGASRVDSETPKVAHSFADGSCSVCGAEEGIYFAGEMNDWQPALMQNAGGNKVFYTTKLNAGIHEFKLLAQTAAYSGWFGNVGTIDNVTTGDGWVMDADANCKIDADGGTYTFTFDTVTKKLTVSCVACPHTFHDTEGMCEECGAEVGHDANYEANGTCGACGASSTYKEVYFDATLSKLSYNGDWGTNSMPIASGNNEGSDLWVHWWVDGEEKGGDVVMVRVPGKVVSGHTYNDVWKASIPREATHVHFYSGNYPGSGSARTVNLELQSTNNCFYADSSDKAIYDNANRDGYWGEPFNIRDPEFLTGSDIVDIPTGSYSNDKEGTMYVGSTFFDYYSDFELNGDNRDDYGNWTGLSHQSWVPFRHFDQVLSKYYELSTVKVPVYTGHFQPNWGSWEKQFEEIAETLKLYGFKDGNAYGSDGSMDQKWFMSVNNSNMNLDPNLGFVNAAAQGIVDGALSDTGALLTSGVEMPYFNKDFLRGENYKNAVVGEVFENVQFPFTTEDRHGDGIDYWVFDSSKTTLQMKQDGGTYFLDQITDANERNKYMNLNASSQGTNTYGFFPFNDGATAWNANTYNYGFGVRLDIPFDLTEDGKKVDRNGEYKDIIFEFSGDDDVWVFIDGVLVLDIGGSHGKVTGTINFATLEATVSKVKSSGGSTTQGDNVVSKFTLNGARTAQHTLTMFYMERGLWESNMMVTFNFTPKGVALPTTTSMVATKEWNIDVSSGVTKQPVTVQLQRRTADSAWENVADGQITLNESNNWTYTYPAIEKYADEAKTIEYLYRVVELDSDGSVLNNGEKNSDGLVVTYNAYGDSTTGFGQLITNHQIESQEIVIDFGLPVDITVAGVDPTPEGSLYGIGNPNLVGTGVSTSADSDLVLSGGTYRGKYGTASIVNGMIRYTPNTMNMDSPELITYAVQYQEGSTTEYYHSTVLIIPAANMYYEDYFLIFNDSTKPSDSYGKWSAATDSSGKTQAQDRPGATGLGTLDANNVYGYDSAYSAFKMLSLDGGRKVIVDRYSGSFMAAPTASFTFTGTGFDVIGLTDSLSGAIMVDVMQGNKLVKSYIVNNYYGMVYNTSTQTWEVKTDDTNESLYQVPVIKVEDLTYGTYDVTIRAAYLGTMDMEKNGYYTVWLDAIRIYNPAKGNKAAEAAYQQDGESNPNVTTVKDLLVTPDFGVDTSGNSVNGVTFVEGKDADVNLEEYKNAGPNNETYLKSGNGVAFKLLYNGTSAPTLSLQVGAKLAIGSKATLNFNGTKISTLNSATNMFYELGQLQWDKVGDHYESEPILLSCTDSDGILSLTDIKVTGENSDKIQNMPSDDASGITLLSFTDEEVAEYACENLYTSIEVDDGGNTPGGDDTDSGNTDSGNTPGGDDTDSDNTDSGNTPGGDDTDGGDDNDNNAGTGDLYGKELTVFVMLSFISLVVMVAMVVCGIGSEKKKRM